MTRHAASATAAVAALLPVLAFSQPSTAQPSPAQPGTAQPNSTQPSSTQPRPSSATLSPPDTWLPRDTADLQILDQVNAHAAPVSLKVGQSADNVSLSIVLRSCMVRPPDLPHDSAAYLDIADSRPGAPGFHGWMFANEPAVAMLEHPIYSVRLVACR